MIGAWLKLHWARAPSSRLLQRLCADDDPLAALMLHDTAGPALVMDIQGRLMQCNRALIQMLSGASTLVTGSPVRMLFEPEARNAAWAEISTVLLGHAAAGRVFSSMLMVGEAGQEIIVTALPVRESPKVLSGVVLRFTDITPQRELEAQLAHSQKLQATGQLAGGIAHDFNNLLTAILGAADGILGREPEGETTEDARQVTASAQRGAALVRQLLAFGRQQTLQPRTLAVNDVIEDLSGLLRRLLGGKVKLVLALEKPGRAVRADPTQLDQVIINLAVNARDAMPQGGEITLRSGHITVFRPLTHGAEIIPPGRYVMLEVQDTGTGIAPEILSRIFDPFFTTKRDQGGSGLGLSTVHGIVRQSDGFLAVDSELGHGTSVRIYLPRWDVVEEVAIPRLPQPTPPLAHQPAVNAPALPVGTRGIVLLVDDEDAVRKLAARALSRAGWEVLQATCGESALGLLKDRPVDAVPIAALISDMVMPGIDGTVVAQEVRELCGRVDLPVILVSGYAESPLHGGLQAQATVFLAKPYTLADLATTLERVTNSSS